MSRNRNHQATVPRSLKQKSTTLLENSLPDSLNANNGLPDMKQTSPLYDPNFINLDTTTEHDLQNMSLAMLMNDDALRLDQGNDTSTSEKSAVKKRPDKYSRLEEELQKTIGSWSLALYMVNQPDGEVMLKHTSPLSARLTDLSRRHKEVYEVLLKVVTGNVYTALALEVSAIVNALAQNHGIDPNPVTAVRSLFGRNKQQQPVTTYNAPIVP